MLAHRTDYRWGIQVFEWQARTRRRMSPPLSMDLWMHERYFKSSKKLVDRGGTRPLVVALLQEVLCLEADVYDNV